MPCSIALAERRFSGLVSVLDTARARMVLIIIDSTNISEPLKVQSMLCFLLLLLLLRRFFGFLFGFLFVCDLDEISRPSVRGRTQIHEM